MHGMISITDNSSTSNTTYYEHDSASQDTVPVEYVDTTFWWILWFVSTFTVLGLCIYIKSDYYERSRLRSRVRSRYPQDYQELKIP
jgi:hypothetical protein